MKNIINYILNVIYFVKLLSIIEQLKDQVNSEITLNVIINIEIEKILINENIINYNKIYIDIIIFINAFIFYIIIYNLHNINNLSFNSVIFLYIQQIFI